MNQSAILHLTAQPDGRVRVSAHFDPSIDTTTDSARVPSAVESVVEKMLRAAVDAGGITEPPAPAQRCPKCHQTGIDAEGLYCYCKMGRDLMNANRSEVPWDTLQR